MGKGPKAPGPVRSGKKVQRKKDVVRGKSQRLVRPKRERRQNFNSKKVRKRE